MDAVLKRCEYCNLLYCDKQEDNDHPERWKCGGACDAGCEKLIIDVSDDECNGYDKLFADPPSGSWDDYYDEED